MNILITGGVGFIGTNTAVYFSKNNNNKITIVDNFSRKEVEKNALFLKQNFPKIKIIKTNVIETSKYLEEIKRADVIIHLAGQTAVTTSINDPDKDFQTNILSTFKLLEVVRINNPKVIFIYSSTNKVYGDLNEHKLRKNLKEKNYQDICHPYGIDESENLDFISPYGCSKGAADLYCLDYGRVYKMNTVVFRQSCIYGPFQFGVEDQGWIAFFSKQFLFKKSLTIYGDGYQIRDLLYVDDLINAYQSAINNIKKVRGQAFNIGGGIKNAYSLLQVIEILKNNFGYKIKIGFDKTRLGDQKYFVSKNEKIKKMLGWKPKVNFRSGVKNMINWQKNNL
ncbi:MAG: GDP-mannose 4,6-dehydratase [Patescibacteria group bacterium]|jgi:CDP-paratose 2-epimerase